MVRGGAEPPVVGKTLLTKLAPPAPSLVTLHHSPRRPPRKPSACARYWHGARSSTSNIDAHHKKPVHCPKAKTKKQKRGKHRKHKSPQNHDKSKSRASASPASLPQNIFVQHPLRKTWSLRSGPLRATRPLVAQLLRPGPPIPGGSEACRPERRSSYPPSLGRRLSAR
jgi:hypothetical protein